MQSKLFSCSLKMFMKWLIGLRPPFFTPISCRVSICLLLFTLAHIFQIMDLEVNPKMEKVAFFLTFLRDKKMTLLLSIDCVIQEIIETWWLSWDARWVIFSKHRVEASPAHLLWKSLAYRFWLSRDNRFSVSRNCMSEFLSDVWVTKSSSFVSFNSFFVEANAAWASSNWTLQIATTPNIFKNKYKLFMHENKLILKPYHAFHFGVKERQYANSRTNVMLFTSRWARASAL